LSDNALIVDSQTRSVNCEPLLPAPAVTSVERHGIEPIPDAERTATIFDFMRVEWGGLNSLATAVLGAFPIILGLSFWQGLAATTTGVLIGAFILAPMAIFGPLSGTNNAVSSSAHFGVVGRIVGSFLSLLTAVAFFSISVWSSGDAVVGAAIRAFGVQGSETLYAAAYSLFIVSVLVVCIYGFRLMLLVNKIAVVAASALFLTGFYAFWPSFDSRFPGAGLQWGAPLFWRAFVSAALIGLANPISFGAFLGDWSRYVPRATSKTGLMAASTAAQALSLVPFTFGLVTSSIIAREAPLYLQRINFTGGLLAIAPSWFFVPLFLLALLSGMSTGTTSLYGTGLDFSSVFPGLSRPRATLLIGSIAAFLIFVGRFWFNIIDSITAFVSLIVVATTPWMIIMMTGYVIRRGHYLPDAMQVFNRGQRGGAYWFYRGWNLAGCFTWGLSSLLALATVNIPGHFVGWLGNLAGGVDLSLAAAVITPIALYPLFLHAFPEPRETFGPLGPRGVRSSSAPAAPVEAVRPREVN
jgi:purine-cytosine permease-like protein